MCVCVWIKVLCWFHLIKLLLLLLSRDRIGFAWTSIIYKLLLKWIEIRARKTEKKITYNWKYLLNEVIVMSNFSVHEIGYGWHDTEIFSTQKHTHTHIVDCNMLRRESLLCLRLQFSVTDQCNWFVWTLCSLNHFASIKLKNNKVNETRYSAREKHETAEKAIVNVWIVLFFSFFFCFVQNL